MDNYVELGKVTYVTKLAGFEFTKYFEYNTTGEIIALRAKNIRNGRLDLTDVHHINADVSEMLPRSQLNKDDIIFTYTGNGYGDSTIIPESGRFHLAPNICKITPEHIEPYFLFKYIRSNEFLQQVENYMVGSSQPTIPMAIIRRLTIPNVPREAQRAIAEVLYYFDRKADMLIEQNTTLESLAQTYFQQWFLNDNDNSSIHVSELAILDNNNVNPGRQPMELFYHYSIPAFDNAQTPSLELGKTILSNKFCVVPNTILISKLNPNTPRVWRIDDCVRTNSICSTEFQILKPKDMKHYFFLYCLMKSNDVVASFAMSATGTSGSHQRIRPEYILEVEAPAPDENKLDLFNEICTPMMERVKKNQKQILTLQKLRDTLLPKLISGEVRVKI